MLLVLAALLALLLPAGTAEAASGLPAKRPGGITIAPAFQDVTIAADQASASYQFSITNNTSDPLELSLSAVDFGSLDESGGVLFSGDSRKSLDYRYGLAQYVTLERDRLVVDPKKTEKVQLTVTNKESLSPGGHYGAILVSPTPGGGRSTKVEVNQVLSSLLFVRKQGGEIYELALRDITTAGNLFTAPENVELRFQNSGNVHVVPRGILTVTDPRGRVVKRGFINTGSGIVLPETFRRLNAPLESSATSWMPGKYKLTVSYRYDGSAQLQTREYEYYYINGWYLFAMLLSVAVVIAAFINKRSRRLLFVAAKRAARGTKAIVRRLLGKIRQKPARK